jgi:hypothetical protein
MMNTKIKKLLKKLEWSGYQQGQGSGFMSSGGDGRHYPACPICDGIQPGSGSEGDFMSSAVGHRSRCQLKSILKDLEKE